MKVIVVGCGRLGVELAYGLGKRGHDVVVIDAVAAAFNNLPTDFQGRTVEGEALSEEVLHRAGIEDAEALAAITNNDALNAVVAHVARVVYGVPLVAVRNYDPQSRPMLETFGLQIVSSTSWGARRIEEILYHEGVHSVYSAGNGEIEIYELIVPEAWEGRKLSELMEAGESVPASITRSGRALLPTPDFTLQAEDVVHFSATIEGIAALRNRLSTLTEA